MFLMREYSQILKMFKKAVLRKIYKTFCDSRHKKIKCEFEFISYIPLTQCNEEK